MATNIDIGQEKLVDEAVKYKKEAVNEALDEYCKNDYEPRIGSNVWEDDLEQMPN